MFRVRFRNVLWSRGMKPDRAVTLLATNGDICKLPSLFNGHCGPCMDSFASLRVGSPGSHFAFIDFVSQFCLHESHVFYSMSNGRGRGTSYAANHFIEHSSNNNLHSSPACSLITLRASLSSRSPTNFECLR